MPQMDDFEVLRTPLGIPVDAIPQSRWINVMELAAGVAEHLTVPSSAELVNFSCVDSYGNSVGFWANLYGPAAVSSTDITSGSASEPNPILRTLSNVSTISVISPQACKVHMMFYKLRNRS